MPWTQHMSKTWNRPFWYNSETKKSVWVLPEEDKKKMEEAKKEKEKAKAQSETPAPTPREVAREAARRCRYEPRNEFQEYEVTNGFITTTIRARDRHEAMEEMRDMAQSLNPYD